MATKELKKGTVLTIKRQSITFKVNRTDVVSAQPKHDGVVFQLNHGLLIDYTDGYMPASAKELICNSLDSMPNCDLVVDFDNYRKPISGTVS